MNKLLLFLIAVVMVGCATTAHNGKKIKLEDAVEDTLNLGGELLLTFPWLIW